MARGKLTLSQLQSRVVTGNGAQITSFGGGAMTPGSNAVWDASGNIISGVGGGTSTHSESLTDGASNFIFANGEVITVVGVPN